VEIKMDDVIVCSKCGYDEKGFFLAMAKNFSNFFTKESIDNAIIELKKGLICPMCKTRIIII